MWFFNQKRADQVAQSISQLIHTLSDGRKNHGPTSPERLLREFATLLSEDTIIGQRVVKLLMATTTKAKFLVSLAPGSFQSQADLRRARRVFRIFARLLLAAANGDDRFASSRGRTAGAAALCGLQGHAQRGRTPRLSLGSLKRSRYTRPAPHDAAR
jgi:hypothetical protein